MYRSKGSYNKEFYSYNPRLIYLHLVHVIMVKTIQFIPVLVPRTITPNRFHICASPTEIQYLKMKCWNIQSSFLIIQDRRSMSSGGFKSALVRLGD